MRIGAFQHVARKFWSFRRRTVLAFPLPDSFGVSVTGQFWCFRYRTVLVFPLPDSFGVSVTGKLWSSRYLDCTAQDVSFLPISSTVCVFMVSAVFRSLLMSL